MSQGTKPRFCIVSPSEIRSIEAAEFSQPPQGRDRKFPREGEISISVWRNLMLNDFLGITPQYIESVREAHYQILVEVPGAKDACERASAVLGDLRNLMPHVEATISNAQMTLQQVIPSTEQVGLAAGAIGAMAREATDQLREAAPGVREMMDASGPALRAVTSACHAAENTAHVLSGTIDSTVAGIKEKFSQIASKFNWAKDMWRHLGSLLLLINNMSLTAPGCYMQMFFTNVIALFGQDIAMWAMKAWFGDKPVNELPDGELIELQLMREGYSPEAAHHEALIPEVGATTLATIISAVIAGIFLFATNTPLANFDSTIKYFGDKCRNLNNINLFFDKHCPLFSWISEWLVTLIKGPTASEDIAKVVDGYTTWAEEVIALSRVQKDGKTVVDAIQSDPKVVYIIDRLYWRGLQMMDTITKYKSINPTQLHKLFKLVEAWRKLCDQTGVFGNKPRRPPFVAFIYGESGVGKSGLTLPYAQDLIVAKKGMFEPTDLYMRNVEQEFWDGYFGQLCVIYDDCLQKLDSKTNPNPEIMEIIRTGNLIPFNLHMAVLEQKARSRFTSEIVICSSNKHPSRVSMESIVHKKAFFRRLTVCAKARLLPEYSVMIDNEERLDTSKVAACDTRPYIFDLVDPASEETIRAGLTYEQLLEHSIEKMADIEVRGEAFNGAYEKRVDAHRVKYLTGRYALAKERLPDLPPVETPQETPVDAPAATQQVLGGDINAGVYYSRDRQAVDIPIESWEEDQDYYEYSDLDLEGALQAVENLVRPREEKPTLMKRIKLELKNVAQTFRRTIKELTFKQQILIAVGAAASIIGLYFVLRGAKNYQRKQKKLRPLQERAQEIIQEAFLSGDEKTSVAARAILESYTNATPAPITTVSRMSTIKDTLRGLVSGVATIGVSEAAVSSDNVTKHSTKATTEAQQSSDMSTNKTPLARTEATAVVSGDNITEHSTKLIAEVQQSMENKALLAKMEAAVSSDQTTRKVAQASTEGFASGDARTVKVPTAKTEAHMQMWADKSAQALIAHRIWNNFYRIYLMSSEGSMRGVVNGLFIRDTIMLTVAHMPQLVQPGDVFMLAGINDKAYEVPVKDCKMEYIRYSSGDKKDAMLIQFPRIVASHSDIVKHFQTREDQHHVAGAAVLPVYRIGVKHEMNTALLATNDFAVEDARVTMNGEEKNFRHMIGYSMPTEKGDCGSPLVVQERTRIRKIVGIHDLALDSGARSYAVNITQEDLKPVLSKFTDVIIRDLDSIPFLAPPAETQGAPLDLLPVQNLAYIGKCTQVPYAPTKSDIIPSALHNKVYPAKTRPAVLYDKEEDIMVKAIAKAALHTPYLDQEAVKAAANDVTRELCKNTNKSKHLRRVLTLEEAIEGVGTDDEYLGPINRRTSPGYPWTIGRKGMGKQQWLGKDDNYTCTPDLRLAVVSREKRAKKGIATPAIWTDCLKDERRSEEKVQAKKTRVFSCGPQDFTILWRMYFLGFIAHIIHNRITNEQSVGTNPYGGDWLMTARKLMQKGKAVIAGDFSSFDGTLNTLIMWEFVNTVNTWYADSEANQMLRRVLMIEVVNAVHLCKGIYYMCDHSQPSGNPATTILNSFYNSVSMRMVFNMCVPNKKFSDVVSMVSYGDDNVVNIDESVLEKFNQNTITAGYAKLGMTYTDEAKTTGQVAPYRTLGEVTYLKRYFIAEGTDWLCPLEFDAMVERINWLRECPSHKAQTLMNCRDCINELSFLDKETFERESTRIKRACLEILGELPETLTFQQYRELRQATHLA